MSRGRLSVTLNVSKYSRGHAASEIKQHFRPDPNTVNMLESESRARSATSASVSDARDFDLSELLKSHYLHLRHDTKLL